MTFGVDPTVVPDHDADQVLPATYRNIAPWDSRFAGGMECSTEGQFGVAQAALGTPVEQESDAWVSGTLMGLYND